jgi:hypothetical protein
MAWPAPRRRACAAVAGSNPRRARPCPRLGPSPASAPQIGIIAALEPAAPPPASPSLLCSPAAAPADPSAAAAAASSPSAAAAGRRWWRGDGPVPAEVLAATTRGDVVDLLRDYVHEAGRALAAVKQEEEGWWGGGEAAEGEGAEGGVGSGGGGGGGWKDEPMAEAAEASEANGFGAAAAAGPAAEPPGAPPRCAFDPRPRLPPGMDPSCPAARVISAVRRYTAALKCVHLLAPASLIPLMGTDLETGRRPGAVPDSFWRGVVRELRPTAAQVDDCREIRALYSAQMDRWALALGRIACLFACLRGACSCACVWL